jgi:hypothetical protein
MSIKTGASHATFRPLTQEEIDRRIDTLAQGVATSLVGGPPEPGRWEPRWISAAELVRRMRPFIVLN